MCPLRPDMQYATRELTRTLQQPNLPETSTEDARQRERVQQAHSHKLRPPQIVAQSSAEAELYAIGTTVNDVIYVRNILRELQLNGPYGEAAEADVTIYTDNRNAKCLATQLGITKRSKHVDIRYLHVQQLHQEGALRLHKVGFVTQAAQGYQGSRRRQSEDEVQSVVAVEQAALQQVMSQNYEIYTGDDYSEYAGIAPEEANIQNIQYRRLWKNVDKTWHGLKHFLRILLSVHHFCNEFKRKPDCSTSDTEAQEGCTNATNLGNHN
eukprot:6492717-Amphidinium_carterae.1